jgi:hypothetical protein
MQCAIMPKTSSDALQLLSICVAPVAAISCECDLISDDSHQTKLISLSVCNFSITTQATPHTSRTSHLTPHAPHTSHLTHLTPHTSHLTPHTSHLTPHTSHLTPHTSRTSHLTPHTSHLTHLTPHTSHTTPHTPHTTPHTPHTTHCLFFNGGSALSVHFLLSRSTTVLMSNPAQFSMSPQAACVNSDRIS